MKECYKNKKSLSIEMHNQVQDHRGNACLEIADSRSTKDFHVRIIPTIVSK